MAMPTPLSFTPAIDCHAQGLIDAKKEHPNKKKIFVFCDGTGNQFADSYSSKEANSNVVKLYTALRVTDQQMAYYRPGVGTMGDPSIRYALPRWWSKVKGLAFGAGFQANVLEAYRYLMDVYNDGDEIYVFGFSRGAYTARALGGMLHGYGLLCRGNEGHLVYAWKMFVDALKKQRDFMKEPRQRGVKAPAHKIERNYAFAETYSRMVTIRFMGVWDTVSSVGWIYEPLRLLDMAQNPIIQVGRHAVSIDERRANFRDNLWGEPVGIDHKEWPDALRSQGIQQDIAQVWFPGVHSDIGGSYPQWETAAANESLRWMAGEVQRQGAELCQERLDMVLGTPSGEYAGDRIFAPPPTPDHCLHDSLTWKWWLLQLFPQQYYDKDDGQIEWRTPYWRPRKIPKQAILHGSAVRRLESTVKGEEPYRPHNLKRGQYMPLAAAPTPTSADLTGCFIYTPGSAEPPSGDPELVRLAKLGVGWITFGLFWVIVGTIVWYVLSLLCSLFFLVILLVAKTPGFQRLFHWIFCHL